MRKLFDNTSNFCLYISGILLFIITIGIMADSLGRYLFNHPLILFSQLIYWYGPAALTFLAILAVQQRNRHIQTTLITSRLSPRWRVVALLLSSIVGLIVFVILGWQFSERLYEAVLTHAFWQGPVSIPRAPLFALLAVMSFLMIIEFLSKVQRSVEDLISGKSESIQTKDEFEEVF
jgi:TRAP-type C4-dicarboxylate transport system permease small subunit